MELENEADVPVAECRQFFFRKADGFGSVYIQFATVRRIECPDDLEQGRFSCPARTDNRYDLALAYRQVDPFQYLQGAEAFGYSFCLYHIS